MADYIERISIHAPLAGRDVPEAHSLLLLDISIHAPLAGRDDCDVADGTVFYISIHAPLAGRDAMATCAVAEAWHFNPRAPCGARLRVVKGYNMTYKFQSTRPLRGATWSSCRVPCRATYFNPRAPCGARLDAEGSWSFHKISIHAPLAGRDTKLRVSPPTQKISIHAPLAGRDITLRLMLYGSIYFNPRAPCGARPFAPNASPTAARFQSTRPLRGATGLTAKMCGGKAFQSTRPLRGATFCLARNSISF